MKKRRPKKLKDILEKPKPKSMKKTTLKRLREILKKEPPPTPADQVIISEGTETRILVEGKWLKGDFDDEIRVDRNTHMRSGEKHAHIHDRKGNEMYALNQAGKPSHNSKPFKLSKNQANALRRQGFDIPKNRIVEAT